MANKEQIIYSDNFTDADGNIHYFNTGRDNISGKSFPNHYVRNKDNYGFTRVLNIKLSTDTSLIYPIHECFILTAFGYNKKGISNIITLDAIVKDGKVKPEDIKLVCTPLNCVSDLSENMMLDIRAAIKSTTENGSMVMNLGIWLNTSDVVDYIIRDISSLAANEIPNNIYNEYLECDYEAQFLNNEDIVYDVNMFNYEESIGEEIAKVESIYQKIIDKIKNLNDITSFTIPDYKFLSVIYDDMYLIKDINTDEIIKPTAFQYVQTDNDFAIIKDNYIQVKEKGNYIIALKVNMGIHEGNDTKMMMSLFINDDRIQETTSSVYLNPNDKVGPFGFIGGQFQLLLKPSDKLYLKARWTNKDNVTIENHCTVQITKLNTVL